MCRNAGRRRQPVFSVSDGVVPTWRTGNVHAGRVSPSPVHDDVAPRRRSSSSRRRRSLRAPAARLPASVAGDSVLGRSERRRRERGPEPPASVRRCGTPRSAQRTRTHAGCQRRIIARNRDLSHFPCLGATALTDSTTSRSQACRSRRL